MSVVAARIDNASRQRMLREMGIEPMQRRAASAGHDAGAGRCLLLVPQSVREAPAQARLIERIVQALALPEACLTLLWSQGPGMGSLPAHAFCLVMGDIRLDQGRVDDDAVFSLPSVEALLHEPAAKRQVWLALRHVRRQLAATA